MTSVLKIRCFLKPTAKKFWIRPRGRGRKKSDVMRKEKEEEEEGDMCVTRRVSFGTY